MDTVVGKYSAVVTRHDAFASRSSVPGRTVFPTTPGRVNTVMAMFLAFHRPRVHPANQYLPVSCAARVQLPLPPQQATNMLVPPYP